MTEYGPAGTWEAHIVRAGPHSANLPNEPAPDEHQEHIEPWLAALLQAEHLNLLVGNGLTTAVALAAKSPTVDMQAKDFDCDHADVVTRSAEESAKRLGRGTPNIEDRVRAARELIAGLRVLAGVAQSGRDGARLPKSAARLLPDWEQALDTQLRAFLEHVLEAERGIRHVLEGVDEHTDEVRRLLGGFLLPFASRTSTRERLHIFTTNYDRLIEYGCDLLGLHAIDRFVGSLAPVFHSSRLGIDMHYNPPGIRGEPRYLEGVVRLTKLHGSLDWRRQDGPSGDLEVQRCGLPFGADTNHPELPERPGENVLVYPNPAKDVETLEYPYAELFRDFAAATCRPNAVVITYGYGFGDDHVNRVLRDMLTIPSTHLVIASYDKAEGRIERFCNQIAREEQMSLLIGSHFGHLDTLVEHYLPKPAIDRTTWKMMSLLQRRARPQSDGTRHDDDLIPDRDGTV
jgi:hypothetical protein